MNAWLAGHIILPLHERLMGRDTFATYHALEQSQWFSPAQLAEIQLRKLQALVRVALNDTDFYARFAGLDKSWQPQSLGDLARLPLLDKDTIFAHREELVNRRVAGGPIRYRTGGSSGQPLVFYIDRGRIAYDKAARMRTHWWWGVTPGQREAYIWNSPVELSGQDRLKRFRDWMINDRLMCPSGLSPRTVGAFVRRLRRFRPACVFGYPSAIELVCRLAGDVGLRLDDIGVRVVFTTAEVLYEHQRRLFEQAFGVSAVADGYGSREAGFIAHQCPQGSMHIASENVIVEVLAGDRPAAAGEDGEIVVTQLDGLAMPFIRYRTSDIGRLKTGACPCGRGLGMMEIVQGRSNDFLVAPDGRWVHGSAIHAALSHLPGIRRFQLLQGRDGHVRVLLVTDERFGPQNEQELRQNILQRLGAGATLSIEYRDEIAPGPSGKFRYIISELSVLTHERRQ
jgi:phenylacetate-CoA ligase